MITGDLPGGGSGAWLSTDGGTAWTPLDIPVSHGAGNSIAGLTFNGDGLLAVRNGRTSGQANGVAYFSPDGRTWQYAGTVGAADGLAIRVVKGGSAGLVVTGTSTDGQLAGYVSTDNGATWRPTAPLGQAATQEVIGAAVGSSGTVVAIGSTLPNKISQQPLFLRRPRRAPSGRSR